MSHKILITGGTGMLAHAMKNLYPDAYFISTSDCDLKNQKQVFELFEDLAPTHVFHLAAKVGGILSNKTYIADFYYDNITMNTNVLEASKKFSVTKLVSMLSTCIYPDKISYPLREHEIHNGEPHESNYGYAYSKRMLDIQSRAYRSQYGCNFVTVVPNNLFGENDNFHLTDSHVIPAMIRKIHAAKKTKNNVVLWGDGSPKREFTYSRDIARALKIIMDKYDNSMPINMGNTKEVSIKDLAEKITKNLDYNGVIIWNDSMPNGQHRKPSDNTRFMNVCGKFKYTDFDHAINLVCKWFLENQPNVRGMK